MSSSTENKPKKWIAVLLRAAVVAGCFLAAAKLLHTGFSADEEYQLVMDYRLAMGDRLFGEVWDTIQTSGFLGQLFIRVFLAASGSVEGILLYLRLVGILIQGLTAFFLYSTLKKHICESASFYIGAAFFATFPKMIAMPDFSNMQGWFLTAFLCALWRSYDAYEEGKLWRGRCLIILSALCTCGAVLSTACLIVVPAIMVFLWVMRSDRRLERELCFLLTCAVTGALYLGYVVSGIGVAVFFANIGNILAGDDTHMTQRNIVGDIRAVSNLAGLGKIVFFMAAAAIVATAVMFLLNLLKKKKLERGRDVVFFTIYGFAACGVTLWQWLVLDTGYDGLKLHIPALFLIGSVCAVREKFDRKYLFPVFAMLIGLLAFINVMFISNVPLINNLAFLGPFAFWGLAAFEMYREDGESATRFVALDIALCFVAVIGTGYTLQSGGIGNNIFALDGIVRNGPAKGVILSKDAAYVYYTDYNEFPAVVASGSNVLIVTDFFRNTSVTSCYMLNDVNISHYSVNSTPTYSSKLEEYWQIYPERSPDVIAVNKTVVELKESDWIYSYLTERFGYRGIYNGAYFDYYYR